MASPAALLLESVGQSRGHRREEARLAGDQQVRLCADGCSATAPREDGMLKSRLFKEQKCGGLAHQSAPASCLWSLVADRICGAGVEVENIVGIQWQWGVSSVNKWPAPSTAELCMAARRTNQNPGVSVRTAALDATTPQRDLCPADLMKFNAARIHASGMLSSEHTCVRELV